jgi:hypothetical protein
VRFALGEVELAALERPPIEVWHYAPVGHVLDADVSRYYEPRERVARIHREARPIERYARVGDARVIAGPPPQVLRQHRIDVRSARIDAHAVGRWTPAETRAAEQHARDHRADVDAQNRQRIERDAKLRSRAQPAQPAPQRPAPSNVTRTPAPEPAPPAPPQRSHVRTQEPRRAAPVPPTPAPAQPATPPQPPTPPRPAPREMHRPTPTPPTTTHPPQREPQPPRPAPPQPPRVQPQPPRPAPPAPRAEPREMHQPPPQAQPQPHAPPPQAQPHAPPPPKAAPPSEPRRRDDDHRR